MMQRNPERLVMSLRCPYTWLAGVTHPAPGGLDMRLNNLALYLQLRIGGTRHFLTSYPVPISLPSGSRNGNRDWVRGYAIFMKQGAILHCGQIKRCHVYGYPRLSMLRSTLFSDCRSQVGPHA